MDTLNPDHKHFGIVSLPLIPGRREGSDKAEMVTQLLFGETYTVLELTPKWVLIANSADAYECWIDRKMYTPLSEKDFFDLQSRPAIYVAEVLSMAESNDRTERIFLPAGSRLPFFEDNVFLIGEKDFTYSGKTSLSPFKSIQEIALEFLNAPYLWGGKSILGIDCSGFVQVAMSLLGISLPRDAYQQMEAGVTVDFVDSSKEGDLVFFDNTEGRITHVGIVLEPGKIIHASGKVRIDKLDHQGIYNEDLGAYTHNTRIIKRVISL